MSLTFKGNLFCILCVKFSPLRVLFFPSFSMVVSVFLQSWMNHLKFSLWSTSPSCQPAENVIYSAALTMILCAPCAFKVTRLPTKWTPFSSRPAFTSPGLPLFFSKIGGHILPGRFPFSLPEETREGGPVGPSGCRVCQPVVCSSCRPPCHPWPRL